MFDEVAWIQLGIEEIINRKVFFGLLVFSPECFFFGGFNYSFDPFLNCLTSCAEQYIYTCFCVDRKALLSDEFFNFCLLRAVYSGQIFFDFI